MRAKEVIEHVKPFLPHSDRLLDVGSGVGALLKEFSNRGWQVTGVEPSVGYARYVRNTYGLPIICSLFEQVPLESGPFDLIVMSHVLEHAFSPTFMLRKARNLASDTALLYIQVPNLMAVPLLGDFVNVVHRYYFTSTTLQCFLVKTGWKILTLSEAGQYLTIVAQASDCKVAISYGQEYERIRRFLRRRAIKGCLFAALLLIRRFTKAGLFSLLSERLSRGVIMKLREFRQRIRRRAA